MIYSIFRYSGRMFWPVGYLLMLMGLLGVLRDRNHAMVAFSLLLIVGLQYYDTGLLRKRIRVVVTQPAIAHSEWEKLVQSVAGVSLYPTRDWDKYFESLRFFQRTVAKYGQPFNVAYLARVQENRTDKLAIFQAPLVAKNLYIITERSSIPLSILDAINHDWCRNSDKGIICVPGSDYQWWQEHGPTFQELDVPLLASGLVIDMSTRGNGANLIGCGFSFAKSWGWWINEKRAAFALNIPRQAWTNNWQMEVTAQAFVVPAHPAFTVEVRVNGEKITEWRFTSASQQKCVATIPGYLLKKDKKLMLIEFNILNPGSPKALGLNQDPRELGLGVSKLTFSQFSGFPAERIHEMQ